MVKQFQTMQEQQVDHYNSQSRKSVYSRKVLPDLELNELG